MYEPTNLPPVKVILRPDTVYLLGFWHRGTVLSVSDLFEHMNDTEVDNVACKKHVRTSLLCSSDVSEMPVSKTSVFLTIASRTRSRTGIDYIQEKRSATNHDWR